MAEILTNRLDAETSPYLLQHADNPVAWQPWGPAALQAARDADKPILLSVGYAACHWCHVMAHESFEDADTAAEMNADFINIKVDREERPDIDAIYQSALALTGQQGGWPLTMFLTPDGEPFWGGTYFPPRPAHGRPSFRDVLRAVTDIYRNENHKVTSNAGALAEALQTHFANKPGSMFDGTIDLEIARRLLTLIDKDRGGLQGAPKFPQPSILGLLWRAYLRTRVTEFRDAVTLSLTRMCQGGIYDHLGGGLARYSTDDAWLVPHFEKMLYDNAQLITLLTQVWQDTRDPLYRCRIEETIGWIEREMMAANGAFAASLDADSEGEEGKFYVWTEDEVDAALGADAGLFKAAYGVTSAGNWEGKCILTRDRQPGLADPSVEAKLASARETLLEVRDRRIRPGWDDKVLADWNGLMIAALAEAAAVFDRQDWLDRAVSAFTAILDTMMPDGRLCHAWRADQARHVATIDDLAAMSLAALALRDSTGDDRYLHQARVWAAEADGRFWDREQGGYFFTADDAEALVLRTKSVHDNATPSGNGMMLVVLAQLAAITGEACYRDRATALVEAFAGELTRNIFPLSTYLGGAALLRDGVQIVIIGDGAAPATTDLVRAVHEISIPGRVMTRIDPDETLPDGHPAAGKSAIDGRPTAYICQGTTCGLPITDAATLKARLGGRAPEA